MRRLRGFLNLRRVTAWSASLLIGMVLTGCEMGNSHDESAAPNSPEHPTRKPTNDGPAFRPNFIAPTPTTNQAEPRT